jgi:ribonuclease HI
METNVYTDGACSNNGQTGAKAGLGVYFSENDPRNCSERIDGKQTNNTAELKAIIKAAEILNREILAGFPVNIYSDSSYAIRCCTTYGEKMEKRNWIKKKPIPNQELVKKAYYTFKDKTNVHFNYIAAHTGKEDEHSLGNEGADKLANLAIGQTECQYANRPKKIYLKLPYEEKEKGKKLGTKWDPKKKKWYIMSNIDETKKETILNLWG